MESWIISGKDYHLYAAVVEWQTHSTQNAAVEISYRFESDGRHHFSYHNGLSATHSVGGLQRSERYASVTQLEEFSSDTRIVSGSSPLTCTICLSSSVG